MNARGARSGAIGLVSIALWVSSVSCARGRTEPSSLPADAVAEAGSGLADPQILVVVEDVNARRAEVGCGPLAWHEGLARVAQAHARDMSERDFYDHVNPDGEDPFDRLAEAGIRWNGAAAENLAIGAGDGRDAFELWMHSPTHRANIENCSFTHHGVGLVDGGWTHIFVENPLP